MSRKTPQREGWRIGTDQISASSKNGFDELVVGDWFHMERMNDADWWLRLGQREADITVSPQGKTKVRWRDEK